MQAQERAVRAIGPVARDAAWEVVEGDGFVTAIARRSGLCVEASERTERGAIAIAYARLVTAESRALEQGRWEGGCEE